MKTEMTVDVKHSDGKVDEATIKLAPQLTVLYHQGGTEVAPKPGEGCAVITAQDTVRYVERMGADTWDSIKALPRFVGLFRRVFDFDPPQDIQASTIDVRHVVGLICLTASALAADKTPFIKLPETYLHPRHQLGLADLFNSWSEVAP